MNVVLCVCAASILVGGSPPSTVRFGDHAEVQRRWIVVLGAVLVSPIVVLAPAATIAAAMVGATLMFVLRQHRTHKRNTKIATATSSYIGLLLGDLRAGSAMPQALHTAAETLQQRADTPSQLLHTATIAAHRARQGAPAAGVFIDAQQRCPDLGTIGLVWSVAEQHGIPLVDLLEQTQRRIDLRLLHRAATSAALQGPQATAVVLAVLPVAGLLLGSAMGADPIGYLFTTTLGGVLLIAGVGLTCGGFLWSRTIIEKAAA